MVRSVEMMLISKAPGTNGRQGTWREGKSQRSTITDEKARIFERRKSAPYDNFPSHVNPSGSVLESQSRKRVEPKTRKFPMTWSAINIGPISSKIKSDFSLSHKKR
jgi:hypothetical protein